MKEISFKVKGMECSGCENRIKNALEAITGVDLVDANHETGIVIVKTNLEIELNNLIEKITDLGFEVIKEN